MKMSLPLARLVRAGTLALSFALVAAAAQAQAPPGYYDTVDTTNGATLRQSLHEVVDDHLRIPYTSSATDTWNVLDAADENPDDVNSILDVYRNASYPKAGAGNANYNREHTWPKSYGFPNDGSTNMPYTDCHMLFLSDDGYNSSRSNKPYRYCSSGCSENPTDVNNGQGGGTGVYPGNSNWTSGSLTAGTWETWAGRRGDVARALLYADVRYEGGSHGVTGVSEPDLILTDDEGLIAASNTGSNESVAYMGMLTVLLAWNAEDPVDDVERYRNDVVFSYQGNRNPFIDHPEWLDCIFSGNCGTGDTTPPAAPTGLVPAAGDLSVSLDWFDNTESDLAGYDVHRSTTTGGPYTKINGGLVTASSYTDSAVTNGTTYHYVVTAVDTSFNSSAFSLEASATPTGGGGSPPTDPWINELHYDNSGTDTGELVEIAGPAGLDLGGWQVIGYNGNGGGTYKTVNLAGTLPDQGGCIGTLSFAFTSMQNGAPDGLALVDDTGAVVEFLSYEGSFTATNGPALGLASTDIGVSESTSSPVGHTLQLGGAGSSRSDFSWQVAQAGTPGLVNAGQAFSGGCGGGGPTPPAAPANLAALAGDGLVDLDWDDNGESDLAGYIVYRSTAPGGPYSEVSTGLVGVSAYTDPGLTNGVTYFYVVTALSSGALESALSAEASATPADTTPPAAPTGVSADAADGEVSLVWNANGEPDLAGYGVYRATSSGGPYLLLNGSLLTATSFTDTTVTNGTTYHYVVTASDGVGNESSNSAEVSATPQAPGSGLPWINEFHYDDSGKDANEHVEIAGPAGFDLGGWTISAYNGNNGNVYRTSSLSGSLADEQGGFGTAYANMKLQNGAPDGIALVDPAGSVVQFLSYEGSFTATSGPAAGLTSTDIGVSEPSSTPNGYSLQLGGSGTAYEDFSWQAAQPHTKGNPNSGQTLGG